MVKVHSTQQLSNEDLSGLQKLIGKTLTSMHCFRYDKEISSTDAYVCLDDLQLVFGSKESSIIIKAEYKETHFGQDFMKLEILDSGNGTELETYEYPGKQNPVLDLNIDPGFTISRIEVYGSSYVVHFDNDDPNSSCKIQQEYPGQPIDEYIETEDTLLLYSGNRRLLLKPEGPFPFINICLNDQWIDNMLYDENVEGTTITRLKHKIG